ncbi:hypothetical protein DYU11_11570 [Fibrisoma montanum]|uniref:Uncharacterized protein n=1 Tax=Fibrisoma montanum TaxID=2305895 RepID=A0A418MB61_9BACT|nr:hypothetical protein [Fibrisoma montanum]RIV23613.1 hypothetical protein DYU11_11570 [Fibrisoma montanum]
MKIRHKLTKIEQTVSADDWKVLQTSGHATNFEVTEEGDYTPSELKNAKPEKAKADKEEK